jgi:hypothetical protein
MKFIVFVKANKDSEAGVMPDQQLLADMSKFNEELVNAGVLLDLNGLHPSSRATRVAFDGDRRTLVDGPFATDPKDLVAGYWVLQTKTRAECIEWVKRAPFRDGELEIRQIFQLEDFELSPSVKKAYDRIEAQLKA